MTPADHAKATGPFRDDRFASPVWPIEARTVEGRTWIAIVGAAHMFPVSSITSIQHYVDGGQPVTTIEANGGFWHVPTGMLPVDLRL